jgi:hypothetical protein
MENIKRAFATPFGVFVYMAVSGMIGVVILLFFFSILFSGSMLAKILPVIISFNAATCGYGLVDKGGPGFPRVTLSLTVIGFLLAITGCLFIAVLMPWEFTITDGVRWLVSGLLALIFSFFGAWIARRNKSPESRSQS